MHVVGDLHREGGVLLGQQDRRPLVSEPSDDAGHLGDEHRGQAFGRLVHDEHHRPRHERACDGQHLLFAAAQLVSPVAAALGQAGEHRKHLIEVPARRARRPGRLGPRRPDRDRQVLVDRQRRKDPTALRDEADAHVKNAMRRQPGDLHAVEEHAARTRGRQADNRAAQRRLPDAVPAEDRGDTALLHVKRDALEHMAVAVVGVHIDGLQHGHSAALIPR